MHESLSGGLWPVDSFEALGDVLSLRAIIETRTVAFIVKPE